MKHHAILLLTVFGSVICNAQTDYYRYNPSTGTSEKIGYSTPSNPPPTTTYVPRVDLNLYREVLQHKQRLYNERASYVRREVNDIDDDIYDIEEMDVERAQQLWKYQNTLKQDLNKGIDLTNEYVYKQVLDNLEIMKQNVRNNRRALRQSSTTAQQSPAENDYYSLAPKAEPARNNDGTVQVYTCAAIRELPKPNSATTVLACDGKVKLLSTYDDRYYHVSYHEKISNRTITGYLEKGMVK